MSAEESWLVGGCGGGGQLGSWLMLPLETPLGHIEGSIRQSTTTPALHPDKHLPAPPILTIICSSPVMREVEVIVMMGMRVCQSCETSG